LNKNELKKFASDFTIVYNKAWARHGGLKQLTIEQVMLMFKQMKPVMDERILWFAYYKNEPIAIFINLPDLNQWFKKMNGQFGLIHKLYFLLLQKFKPNKKFIGLVFGVVPEFQGKGVDAYIIGESAQLLQSVKMHYTDYEMQWIGDFNPKMLNIAQNLGEHLGFTSSKIRVEFTGRIKSTAGALIGLKNLIDKLQCFVGTIRRVGGQHLNHRSHGRRRPHLEFGPTRVGVVNEWHRKLLRSPR
jgi:hypothetical protein